MRHSLAVLSNATACALLFSSGCTSPESEFRKAEATDTVDVYEAFVESYPESELAPQARDRVCDLKLQSVVAQQSLEALEPLIDECLLALEDPADRVASVAGEIKASFVGRSAEDLRPSLFFILEGMDDERREKIGPFWQAVEVKTTFDGSSFHMTNVFPGSYALIVQLRGYGPKVLPEVFEVAPGAEVSLGDIEVPEAP